MRRSLLLLALVLVAAACSGATATPTPDPAALAGAAGAVSPESPTPTTPPIVITPETTAPATTSTTTTTTSTTTTTTTTTLPPNPTPPLDVASVDDQAFTSELALDVYRPTAGTGWPVVVLVPGGGWSDVAMGSTRSLARHIASQGAVVYNAPYRLSAPEAFSDISCAMRFAEWTAEEHGGDTSRLVVTGHSAGAHITAVTALAGEEFGTDCVAPVPFPQPTGWVGISGPYALALYQFLPALNDFFGGTRLLDGEKWTLGDPYTYVDRRLGEMEIALVHGAIDVVVFPLLSLGFEDALEDAGHDVRTEILSGTDHFEVLDPNDAGADVASLIIEIAG